MSPQEFTIWLLVIFAGALFLLLLIVLHERANTRPIQWDDEVNGDASLLGRNGHE